MTRIKANNIQYGESFVMPVEIIKSVDKEAEEALRKREQIILEAEKEARLILEQAHKDAEHFKKASEEDALSRVDEIKQKAHDEGFEAGHEEGIQQAITEMSDKIIAVDTFAKSNFDIKDNIIKSAEKDIIELVSEIAKKVCGTSFKLDDNVLKELTENAIRALKDKESITIIINPELAEKIYSISEKLKEKIPQLQSIKIIEDLSVSADGTIVESPLSRVDSRVKSQITEITEKLLQGFRDVQ